MARLFEALRQAPPPRSPREVRQDQPPILCPVSEDAAEPEEIEKESEIPFIEVGPRRSVEGSAEVLASAPRLRPAPAQPEAVAAPPVVFRPLLPRPTPVERPPLAAELIAYHAPELPAAVAYRHLLAALLPAATVRVEERCPVLLFSAARSGVGATTVLLNVAITAARQGRRLVIVVDANLRQPAAAQRLGLPAAPGLREVLTGAAALQDALQETAQENLLALTAGLATAGPGPRFVAETMRSLLRQLRRRADLVLIDGPCWDGRPEVTSLAAAADAVYLVLAEAEAETPGADALREAVTNGGARLAGCVLAGR
jgi:Mrp family chromosome partitioning ATPase